MKIAFIGGGAMGSALINGIIAGKAAEAKDIILFEKDEERAAKLSEAAGISTAKSEKEAVLAADIIFICVKPQITGIVAKEIAGVADGKIIISIAAGVTVRSYTQFLGDNAKIVRCIPNLPAQVGEGITGVFFYNINDDLIKTEIKGLFEAVGSVVEVKSEKMIDEMIAVTSSSPAYFCIMIEAMADYAVKVGFTRKDALIMAEKAMEGTSAYLLEKGKHPGVLKDEVCSPGGTTIAAVEALEINRFRGTVMDAMEACRKKAVKTEGYV